MYPSKALADLLLNGIIWIRFCPDLDQAIFEPIENTFGPFLFVPNRLSEHQKCTFWMPSWSRADAESICFVEQRSSEKLREALRSFEKLRETLGRWLGANLICSKCTFWCFVWKLPNAETITCVVPNVFNDLSKP